MSQHKHRFAVDAACEGCGIMLSELVTEQQREIKQLARENWKDTAAQESRNRDYYRGLVVEIGELFGVAARTADDGGISDDVLCAKVPELVRAHAVALERERQRCVKEHEAINKLTRDQQVEIRELKAKLEGNA